MFEGLRLRRRSRPALVDALLSQTPMEPGPPAAPGLVTVAAIQMAYRATDDPAAWIEQCQALTIAATRAGAQVLVFPALAPLGLVTSLGAGDQVTAYFGQAGDAPSRAQRRAYERLYPAAHRLYQRTFSSLARRAGRTIVTGGLPAPGRSAPTLVANAFSSDGRPRLHQPLVERGSLPTGAELQTMDAGGSRLATAITDGAALPWLASALTTTRVDLLALLPDQDRSGDADAAIAAASHGGCYVIQPYLIGGAACSTANVRSAVYAPPALTADGSGVLARAVRAGDEEIVLARLTVSDAGRPLPQELRRHVARDGTRN